MSMLPIRLAALSVLILACGQRPDHRPPAGTHAAAAPPPAIDPRIGRIEAELVPAVVIRGAPAGDLALRARMAHFKIPAVSVAVVDRGELAWARAYGAVEPGGAPATTGTLFQAGSISKPVAAMVALRLVQDGVLALDQDVNARLRSWRVPPSAAAGGEKVTLRRLLSHTAGMTVGGFPGYQAGGPVPGLVAVLDGAPPANTQPVRVDIRPGSKWRYSGGGYTVMQQLVIDATGRPFPDVARELVLGPLGMSDSTYQQPLPAALTSRAATGTTASGQPVKGRWHTYPEMAAAGLWTTPTDLARVIVELQSGHRVLSAATAETMLTPVMEEYGLGLRIVGSGRGRRFWHGGDDAGFQALLVASTTRGWGAVVMVNSDRGRTLADDIVRAIAREYEWPDYPPGQVRDVIALPAGGLRRYQGTFEGQGLKLVVARAGGGLVLYEPRDPSDRLPLHASSETSFFATDEAVEVEFVVQGDAVTGMRLGFAGVSRQLRRVR
jgi:CubicO group peptidase (beta-lactamase class C family)